MSFYTALSSLETEKRNMKNFILVLKRVSEKLNIRRKTGPA